ncbi:MAG: hypothetical protein DCC67_14100 [Planctomycetota bacterium]|nr:MAG: hypothetical protein DCC67_14100 [Planctomycetota bacterium]
MRLFTPSGSPILAATLVLLAAVHGRPSQAHADEPALAFDFGRALECRDVTPAEFSEQYPDERIVQLTLRLSVYLTAGAAEDVESIRVEIDDADERLRVHAFSPGTRLESPYAADIETTRTVESSHSFEASLGGELPVPLGAIVAHVTPTVGGGKGGKEVVTEKTVRTAPKLPVIASGTMNSEHGVFFILRASPTTSLEGVHELSIQYRVPAHWRGDAVRVSCQAIGKQKTLWMTHERVWAQKSTPVALYLAGDSLARRAAERYVRQ